MIEDKEFEFTIESGKTAFSMTELAVSVVMSTMLCILGVLHFRKTEKVFVDVI